MGHHNASGAATPRRAIPHRRSSAWPFKVRPHETVTVTDQGVGVPRRQEVEFADGSRIWLQRVEHQGVPQLFLRELGTPAAGTQIDLRRLVPDLATDLPVASTRDVAGIVHYSLRGRFASVDQLLEVAIAVGRPA